MMGRLVPFIAESSPVLSPVYTALGSSSSGTTKAEFLLQGACEQQVSQLAASDFQHPSAAATRAMDTLSREPCGALQKPLDAAPGLNSIWAAFGSSAAAGSGGGGGTGFSGSSTAAALRTGSSLSSTLSGVSDTSSLGPVSGASTPPSCPSPRQVLPQQPAACKPSVALPAPSGQGAMLLDAASGRLEWVQPSGPRKAGEGTEPEQQGIVSFTMLPQGSAIMSITLLTSGFIIGPSGCTVRELVRSTGADIKSWSDSFPSAVGGPRPSRTFLLQGLPGSVLTAAEVIAAAVVRYKYLCEGACFGQQVSRAQVVRGITFVYLPPPRRKVPFAAAIASTPLARSMPGALSAAPQARPATRLSAAAPAWPPQQLQPSLRQEATPQQPQRILQRQTAKSGGTGPGRVPPLQLQTLPGDGSIWSAAAETSGTGWLAAPAAAAATFQPC